MSYVGITRSLQHAVMTGIYQPETPKYPKTIPPKVYVYLFFSDCQVLAMWVWLLKYFNLQTVSLTPATSRLQDETVLLIIGASLFAPYGYDFFCADLSLYILSSLSFKASSS